MVSLLAEKYEYVFEPALLEELDKIARIREVDTDVSLMNIGQDISHMPLILNGSIKIMSEDEDSKELLLYYLETGDTCAMTIQCCSGSKKSQIHAVTEEPTTIAMIPVQKMEEWMVKYKSWRNFILESYHTRLSEMLEAIDNLAFHNMEERVHKYLRDKAMVMGTGELKTTHSQIATELNSSRVVISRLMKKLELEGKVKQHRNLIEVVEFMS